MKKMLIFQSILLCSGIVFGIIAYVALPDEQVLALQQYLTAQVQNLTATVTLPETAGRIFRANAMDMVRVYLAGICLLGLPILFLFLFLKGFTFGFVSCFLLRHSPLLIITRFLYLPVFVLAVGFAVRFGFLLIQNRLTSPARQLLEYTITFGLILILALLFSYVDGLGCCHYLQNLS